MNQSQNIFEELCNFIKLFIDKYIYIIIIFLILYIFLCPNNNTYCSTCNKSHKGNGLKHDDYNNIHGGGEILVLKLFYVDWCGHCKAFKPLWGELKEQNIPNIKFEEINCDTNQEIAIKEKIEGFPTIRLYNSNNKLLKELDKERTINNIVSLINKYKS
jgi:thiol-disulfide isomerase/thioredoxin